MPRNKKESFIYTILMCCFMVLVMSIYNVGLNNGMNLDTIKIALIGFPIAFVVGMIGDWFIVARPAKAIAFKMLNKDSSMRLKIIVISSCMVIGMVVVMSLFGAIEQNGINENTLKAWMFNIPKNFILALPLQLLVAGPLVRKVFRILVPIETTSQLKTV